MIKTKVIKEKLFGDCTGAIYIDLVHEASETILNAETLYEFSKKLYHEIYRTERWDSIIVCFNDHNWFINDLNAGSITEDLKWFKIYHEYDCQFCDQIELIKEEKIKKVIFDGSDCCACIYSDIIKEIAAVISEPDVMHRFANELFKDKEKDNKRDLYISANTSNYVIADTPVNIEDYYCSETNRYYHYYAKDKSRDDSDMMFVEIEWKGNQE